MCPSGAQYVHSYFNKLALLKSKQACWRRTKLNSSSPHWKFTFSRREIADKWLTWRLTTITHPVVLTSQLVFVFHESSVFLFSFHAHLTEVYVSFFYIAWCLRGNRPSSFSFLHFDILLNQMKPNLTSNGAICLVIM
jgi:hypothetical protein